MTVEQGLESTDAVLTRARAMVQWCYSERSGPPGSVFEQFSGKGAHQKEKPKLKTKQPRYIEGEPNSKGERPLILVDDSDGLSATRVFATESQTQKNSKVPIESGRTGRRVLGAIASLPRVEQVWVNYCYNPSPSKKAEAKNHHRTQHN